MFLVNPAIEKIVFQETQTTSTYKSFDPNASARIAGKYVMKADIPGLIEQGEFDALAEYAGSLDPWLDNSRVWVVIWDAPQVRFSKVLILLRIQKFLYSILSVSEK